MTLQHIQHRAAWATRHAKAANYAWVDVDEKWFYAEMLHVKVKRAPGVQLGHSFCKSKTMIPKIMFPSAVARPRRGFDGKQGI